MAGAAKNALGGSLRLLGSSGLLCACSGLLWAALGLLRSALALGGPPLLLTATAPTGPLIALLPTLALLSPPALTLAPLPPSALPVRRLSLLVRRPLRWRLRVQQVVCNCFPVCDRMVYLANPVLQLDIVTDFLLYRTALRAAFCARVSGPGGFCGFATAAFLPPFFHRSTLAFPGVFFGGGPFFFLFLLPFFRPRCSPQWR